MDRVCINKISGKLIEMQSGGDDRPDLMEARLNTLLNNAINAGYTIGEVEVKWVESSEVESLLEIDPNIAIRAQLKDLDERSIRAMREWLAAVEEPPAFITQYEQEAQELREQLT